MKKLILNLLIIVIAIPVKSQIQFGVKAGANISNIIGDNNHSINSITYPQKSIQYLTKLGYNGGIFIAVPIKGKFSLQPELIYSLQGARFRMQNVDVSGNLLNGGTGHLNLSYVQIPVLAKFTFHHKFYAQTGPQIGFLVSAEENNNEEQSYYVKSSFHSVDIAWGAGIGFTCPSGTGFDLRYTIGITSIDNNSGYFNDHNSNLQLGIFFLIRGDKHD
jgi:hypothetical protein